MIIVNFTNESELKDINIPNTIDEITKYVRTMRLFVIMFVVVCEFFNQKFDAAIVRFMVRISEMFVLIFCLTFIVFEEKKRRILKELDRQISDMRLLKLSLSYVLKNRAQYKLLLRAGRSNDKYRKFVIQRMETETEERTSEEYSILSEFIKDAGEDTIIDFSRLPEAFSGVLNELYEFRATKNKVNVSNK